ncbi:MAG: hypothetical protein KDD31_04100 [Muricauda sp.]|jgi:hypothetical protein|nr:hypothetical protein [Allomuricauda sp.]
MTYKIKSLIYFLCFVLASVSYYLVDQHDQFQKQITSESYVETNFQDADDLDQPVENLEEEQQ